MDHASHDKTVSFIWGIADDVFEPSKQAVLETIHFNVAAFHIGKHLRRDRYIRDRLRNAAPP